MHEETTHIATSQPPVETYGDVMALHPDMPHALVDRMVPHALKQGEDVSAWLPQEQINSVDDQYPAFEEAAVAAAESDTMVRSHDWVKIAKDVPISKDHSTRHEELGRQIDTGFDERSSEQQRAISVVAELGADSIRSDQEPAEPLNGAYIGAEPSKDEYRIGLAREQIHIPEGVAVKQIVVIDKIDDTKLARVVEAAKELGNDVGSAEAWQRQTFGETDIATLRQDAVRNMEIPVTERKGDALMVGDTEKRPMMDIGLDEAARLEVVATIMAREKGLASVYERLNQAKENGETMSQGTIRRMMQDAKIIGRHHGNLLNGVDAGNPGGTIADLYLDNDDLRKYDAIDELIQDVVPSSEVAPISIREKLANQLVVLASNSFPSGVEMMHGISSGAIEDVIALGAIAPRSQRMHGTASGTNVNGAFVHMTGPAGFAKEYGTTVVGIPIDTIVKRSPYMQLEDDYVGNTYQVKNADGTTVNASDQYHMGAVQLRSLDDSPLVFRAAFNTMQQNIRRGLMHTGVNKGSLNNLSFAASGDSQTAAGYSYPLSELSVYVDGKHAAKVFDAAERQGKTREIAERTSVVYDTTSRLLSESRLNSATLPNFNMPDMADMTFFAPLSVRSVQFTEKGAGNSKTGRSIRSTLESIKANAVAEHIDGLVEDGMPLQEAVVGAVDSINSHEGSLAGLVQSYVGGEANFKKNGITLETVLADISDEAFLRNILVGKIAILNEHALPDVHDYEVDARWSADRWVTRGEHASPQTKRYVMQAYADRLFAADPQIFAEYADTIIGSGATLSIQQQAAIHAYKAEQVRRSEASTDTDYRPPALSF